jgi:hypothetical protein
MKRLLNTAYPVRFWLTSVLWASVFLTALFISELGDEMELLEIFGAWVFVIFYAAAFSLPSFVLVHFVFFGLLSKELPAFKRKAIIVVIASVGMFATCLLTGIAFSEFGPELFISGSYMAGFLISSFLCDIEKHKQN